MEDFLKRFLPICLLFLHLLLRFIFPNPHIFIDLYLFNAVAISLLFTLFTNSKNPDLIEKLALATAIALWSLGSILSTYSQFHYGGKMGSTIPNICYLFMYPFAFLAISRTIRQGEKLGWLEIVDATILGIGLSAVGSAFLIDPILPRFSGDAGKTFFAILFPVADLVLVALVVTLSLISPFSKRNLSICAGVLIFALSDFLFLGLTIRRTYSLGSITDDLWLVGFVILVDGICQAKKRGETKFNSSLHPIFIAITVLICATLLGIASLRPNYFPNFILIPTIATLTLAFFRMTIALNQASQLNGEKDLARTDELTGLPNRRKFLAELGAIADSSSPDFALLLLDLDGFKPINDLYGHEIGDKLLKEVSKRFSRSLPQGAILARLGGDEFGAIVRGNDETTLEIAMALRATLSYPFFISEREIKVGVSVGHAPYDGGTDLMHRADQAMYRAKQGGVGVWTEPI